MAQPEVRVGDLVTLDGVPPVTRRIVQVFENYVVLDGTFRSGHLDPLRAKLHIPREHLKPGNGWIFNDDADGWP